MPFSRSSTAPNSNSPNKDQTPKSIIKYAAKLEKQIRLNNRRKLFISFYQPYRANDVHSLAIRLTSKGFLVWIDHKKKLCEDQTLPEEIRECEAFLMFASEGYVLSKSCENEAMFALENKKQIVLISLDSYIATKSSWYDENFRSRLSIDFSCEKREGVVLEKILENLAQEEKMIASIKNCWQQIDDDDGKIFQPINVPLHCSGTGYQNRPKDEATLLKEILYTVNNPEEGILMISGSCGIGKTILLTNLLNNKIDHLKTNPDKKIAVIWMNCSKWRVWSSFESRGGKRDAFLDELAELSKRGEDNFHGSDPSSLIPYFKAKNMRVLFVFDNMFDAQFLQHFVIQCKNSTNSQPACCAITTDPVAVPLSVGRVIRKVERVEEASLSDVRSMLTTCYGLGGQLSQEKLAEFAEICHGRPAVADLLATAFKLTGNKKNDPDFDTLTAQAIYLKSSPSKIVSQLFKTIIETFDFCMRNLFYMLLLFDNEEEISSEIASVLWHVDLETTRDFMARFSECSLVRLYDDKALVQKIIHDAAVENAGEVFHLENYDLRKLRLALILTRSEAILFETVRRKCLPQLGGIVQKLSPNALATICQQHSSSENGETFLQFIYKISRKEPENGAMTNFVVDLLLKLESGCEEDVLLEAVTTQAARQTIPNSFLLNVFDDMNRLGENRFAIAHLLEKWRPLYVESAWKRRVLTHEFKNRLLVAVVKGDNDAFERLLPRADMSEVGDIFIAAVRCNRTRMVNLMVFNDPEIVFYQAQENNYRNTALMMASQNGHHGLVKFLAEKQVAGDDPGTVLVQNSEGKFAAWFAAENGHLETVRYLCNVNKLCASLQAFDHATPLWVAAQNGHLETVKFLAEMCEESAPLPDGKGRTPLWIAASKGRVEVFEFLYHQAPQCLSQPDNSSRTPLWIASQNNRLEVVKSICEKVDDIEKLLLSDKNADSALFVASKNGCLNVVRVLIEKCGKRCVGSSMNANGETPLWAAASRGHLDLVKFLFEIDQKLAAKPTLNGVTPIFIAAANNHIDLVRFLYDKEPLSVWRPDEDETTPFIVALEKGHVEIVEFLYEKCRVKHQESNGLSPLYIAAASGHLELVKFLAEKEPQSIVQKSSGQGLTPQMIAERNFHTKVASFLISKQTNSQDLKK